MNGFAGEAIALSDLVRAEEQGLDLNRLLFAKYLVLTHRVSDNLRVARQPERTPPSPRRK